MLELWQTYLFPLLGILGRILLITLPLIIAMAYLTYAERKVLAAIQLRQGPMTVGPFGLLQPFADGIKLLSKETIVPDGANKGIFIIAPMLTFALAMVSWAVIPFAPNWVLADLNVGVLYLLAISSLGVYGLLMAGWASNSRYALLGGLRSAAQMVSYEVSIGLVIVTVVLCVGSFRLTDIVEYHRPFWMTIMLIPMLVIFFVSALAETNRAPFDLPEGESELVGGYNVEYSSMTFAMFFLGEYINMILMSSFLTLLFLGGWNTPFGISWIVWDWVHPFIWFVLKVCLVLFCFIWTRGTLPRFRYDQLMRLGWKVFLPFSLFYVVFVAGILLYTGNLPGIAE